MKTTYFTEPAPYFALVCKPGTIIHSIGILGENLISVSHSETEEFVQVMGNTNPVIAAYTTCQARLKLYSFIEKLDKRVLYFDTDSIIYTARRGEAVIPTGTNLGDMTNELKDFNHGAYITEFVSAGPKNYGYKVYDPILKKESVVVKIRGFTLNRQASGCINFEKLRTMVKEYVEQRQNNTVKVPTTVIAKKKQGPTVVTRITNKLYSVIYNKRIVQSDYTTLPYGFRNV